MLTPLRPWLSRLAMSFIVVAAVLVWTGSQQLRTRPQGRQAARMLATFGGAGTCAALGVTGIRERHRRRDEP